MGKKNNNLKDSVKSYRDTLIIAAIREATAVWHEPQNTRYYAEKLGYSWEGMRLNLYRMAELGLVKKHDAPRSGRSGHTWTIE